MKVPCAGKSETVAVERTKDGIVYDVKQLLAIP
jgi:hypothetical protein